MPLSEALMIFKYCTVEPSVAIVSPRPLLPEVWEKSITALLIPWIVTPAGTLTVIVVAPKVAIGESNNEHTTVVPKN